MDDDAGSLTPPINISSSLHKSSPIIEHTEERHISLDSFTPKDGQSKESFVSDELYVTEEKNDSILLTKKSMPVFGKDKAKKFLKALGSQKKYHSENQSKRSNSTCLPKSTKLIQNKHKVRVDESANNSGEICPLMASEAIPVSSNNNKIMNKLDESPPNSFIAAGTLEALKAYDDVEDCLDTEKTEVMSGADKEINKKTTNWLNKGNRYENYDSRRNSGKINNRSTGSHSLYNTQAKSNNITKMRKEADDFHHNQPHGRKKWRTDKMERTTMIRNRSSEYHIRSLSQQTHLPR